jgi:hypothetical protein
MQAEVSGPTQSRKSQPPVSRSTSSITSM